MRASAIYQQTIIMIKPADKNPPVFIRCLSSSA